MLSLPHVLAGMAVTSIIPSPSISLPLAFGSHFLLDFLPHWDPNLKKPTHHTYLILLIDSLSSLFCTIFFIFRFHSLIPFAGAFLGIFPDLFYIPHYLFHLPDLSRRLFGWQRPFHHNTKLWVGILSQILILILCLILLLIPKLVLKPPNGTNI